MSVCSDIQRLPLTGIRSTDDLLIKIGNNSKYQRRCMLIISLVWFLTGATLMNNNYAFAKQQYQCKTHGLVAWNCINHICKMQSSKRDNFLNDPKSSKIITDLGYNSCDNQIQADISYHSHYLGAIIGMVLFTFLSDNYGRRKIILVCCTINFIGYVLLYCSYNFFLVGLSMTLCSMGIFSANVIGLCILCEICSAKFRQNYIILIHFSFIIGKIITWLFYENIQSWRTITLIVLTIPSIILLLLIFVFVEETPLFLLTKPKPQILKKLNKIAQINFQVKKYLTDYDLDYLIYKHKSGVITSKRLFLFDLCRYPSLRISIINLVMVSVIVYFSYYTSILSRFSLFARAGKFQEQAIEVNFSQLIVQIINIVILLPVYGFINRLPRHKTCKVIIKFLIICSLILIILEFFIQNQDQPYFVSSIKMLLYFVFQLGDKLLTLVFFIQIVQILPTKSRASGIGIVCSFGTIISMGLSFITGQQIILALILSLLGIISLFGQNELQQTKGSKLQEQILQVRNNQNDEQYYDKWSFRRSTLLRSDRTSLLHQRFIHKQSK